jgi:hypothetical protein
MSNQSPSFRIMEWGPMDASNCSNSPTKAGVFLARLARRSADTRGFKDGTTIPTVRRWWTEHPEANLAIATGAGSTCCLDVDVDQLGVDGGVTARNAERPEPPRDAGGARRGARGAAGILARFLLHRQARPRLDVRGDGGYVRRRRVTQSQVRRPPRGLHHHTPRLRRCRTGCTS